MSTPVTQRVRPEACPGVANLHQAEDGLLARVRTPGGRISAHQLRGLSALAERYAQPELELTSRANLQLRGIRPEDAEALLTGVGELGLLPSAGHELSRNVVASPLAGLVDGQAHLGDLIRELDRAICAEPELADLSPRFLFGLDAGAGDVAALAPDAWAMPAAGECWTVWPAGVEVPRDQVVGELIGAARALVGLPGRPRRLAKLTTDEQEAFAVRVRVGRPRVTLRLPGSPGRPTGVMADADNPVAVVAQAPLGLLDPAAVAALCSVSDRHSDTADGALRLTPWGSVVLPLLPCDRDELTMIIAGLTQAGLVIGESPWAMISACTGRPGCGKALADVRADVHRAVERGLSLPEGFSASTDPRRPVHWSGCDRRCGQPSGSHLAVTATRDGYRVTVG